jgi:hypothetical protein
MVAIAQKNRGRVIPADEHASTLEELRAVADQAIAGLDQSLTTVKALLRYESPLVRGYSQRAGKSLFA